MSTPTPHHLTMLGESAEYRTARNKLLTEEMALRRQTESVAALRRALPAGGIVAQDYVFDGNGGPLKLSDLFKPGVDTLAIYSFMYGPERGLPCTGCTHFLDGLEGMVQHITQRINLAVVAKSPLPRLMALARARGWRTLPLLSTSGNNYGHDYFGDSSSLPDAVRKQQDFKAGEEWDMPMLSRCSMCSSGTAKRFAISGAQKFRTCRPSRVRNTATTTRWIRCGTCWI